MSALSELQPLFERILAALPAATEIYLVGGAVRDALLRRPTHDLDFVLPSAAITAARKTANALGGAFYPLDIQRDTGRVILQSQDTHPLVLDFAAFRGPDLQADLRDRDFTINAIALDLRRPDELIDPLEGGRDLRTKVVRACSPASFETDPLRILRCVRHAVQLEFRIQPDTLRLLRASIPRIGGVSNERMRDELFKILEGRGAATAFRTLEILGVIAPLLPELAELKAGTQPPSYVATDWEKALHRMDKLTNLLQVLEPEHDPEEAANWAMGLVSMRVGRYRRQLQEHISEPLNPNRSILSLLLFAALYLQAGEQTIRERGEALRLSNVEITRLTTIVRNSQQLERMAQNGNGPSHREVYRFFRDNGSAGVDICLMSLADMLATYGPELPQEAWVQRLDTVRALLEAWWEQHSERISPPALLNGNKLMKAFKLEAGPEIGRVLEAIREAQAAGEVSTREEALELAKTLIGKAVH